MAAVCAATSAVAGRQAAGHQRRPIWPGLCCLAALAALLLPAPANAAPPPPRRPPAATPLPTFEGGAWRRVETRPGGAASQRPAPPRQGRRRCIDIGNVAGAQLFGDHLIELRMKGEGGQPGVRWRVHLAQNCPALSFYQGFYYRQRPDSRLCAGRDVVGARSGGECAIAAIVRARPEPR
jgi:hypothetical protein